LKDFLNALFGPDVFADHAFLENAGISGLGLSSIVHESDLNMTDVTPMSVPSHHRDAKIARKTNGGVEG
jgi:hypothetical protein